MTLLEMPIRKERGQTAEVSRIGGTAIDRSRPWPRPRVRLTVDQYHRMIAGGILEEGAPIELLDGRLEWKDRSATGEDPMTVGDRHSSSIDAINLLNPKLRRQSCYARIQQPVTLPPHHEPEPDVSIVRGREEDYWGRQPAAADVLCVIEVADSSLIRDRTTKLRAYADAGITMYVIINLRDNVAEIYTQPLIGKGRYGQVLTLSLTDKLTFPTVKGIGVTVPVRRLIPGQK
jgi:Uma2 family endonuclease